jgi:hypothetical protein
MQYDGKTYSNVKQKMSYDYELIAMCYHEAGHTVQALLHYLYVYNVKAMKDGERDGLTEFQYICESPRDSELKRTLLLNEIEIHYAGLVAEKIYYKDISGNDKFPKILKDGSQNDINNVSNIIVKNFLASPGKARNTLKRKMQENVQETLIEHWSAVKMVAHSLYRKRRLDYNDLKSILIEETDNRHFWKEKLKHIEKIFDPSSELTEEDLKLLICF